MKLDLFGSRPGADLKRTAEVKEWVVEIFRLGAEVTVMVTELRCTEPGCPPLETVIAILDTPGQPQQHKIPKPLANVTFGDVIALAGGCLESDSPSENPT